jgi:dienelactone hydrolase
MMTRARIRLVLFVSLSAFATPAAGKESKPTPHYEKHDDLSYYLRDDGTRVEIRTRDDWRRRRRHILEGMQQAMGPLPRPEKPVTLDMKVLEEHRGERAIRRKIAYHTDDPNKVVHAWLFIPLDMKEGKKRPAVLCLHQTNPRGKDSPAGLFERPSVHYALTLANRGYVTLAPDYPSFGEYEYDFNADDYESGSMKAIYDNMRAVDLLQSLPEVDGDRIGAIGHSLGGHNALYTAVFDERIKAVVTSCGFTAFRKYKGGDLHGWSSDRYMPRIGTAYNFDPDNMPFDFHEVLAAIAPRHVFINAPLHDDNFDNAGVRECVKEANDIYELIGHPGRIRAVYPDAAHDFPPPECEIAAQFLDHALRRGE